MSHFHQFFRTAALQLPLFMSGSGRKSNYRKSITEDVLNGFPVPEEGECIAKVLCSRGGNLLETQCPDGEITLAMLPTKFRKLIWVKRGTAPHTPLPLFTLSAPPSVPAGDFVIVSGATGEIATSAGERGKVRLLVQHILYRDQVRHLKNKGLW